MLVVLGIAGVGLAMVYLSPSEPVPDTSSQPRFNTDPIPDTPSQGALHQGENTTSVTGDDFGGLGSNLGGDRLAVTTTAEPSTSTEPPTTTPGEKQTTTQPATTSKKEEATTTADTLERITIGLPFDPKNPVQGVMPMGETIEHPEDVIAGGHPGIDFQWYDHIDGHPTIFASAAGVISVVAPHDEEEDALVVTIFHDDFKIVTNTGEITYYTLYGPIDSNFEFKVGDRIEAGGFLAYVYDYPDTLLPANVYMIHWELGTWETVKWDPADTTEGRAPEVRLCPTSYLDEESREFLEEIWANPHSYEHKDQFPHLCSGAYYGKDG